MPEVGKRIRALRVERRINASELARRAGIGRATLWRVEADPECDPTLSTLVKIADALGVPVTALLDNGAPPAPFQAPSRPRWIDRLRQRFNNRL